MFRRGAWPPFGGLRSSCALLFGLLATFCFLRWHDLTADLPSYFDVGISATDEGTYMDAPRKLVQTGSWNLPGEWWQPQKLVPLYSFMLSKWFAVFGVGFWEGRAMSALIGCLTLLMIAGFGFRCAGAGGAIKLLVIVGSSYTLTHFHRAAMVEALMLFWLWGLIIALAHGRVWWREMVLGICSAGLVLTKLSGVLALPGVALWWLVRDGGWRNPVRWLKAMAGFAIPFALVEMSYPGFLGRSLAYSRENFGSLFNPTGAPWHLLHISVRGMWLSREAGVVALMALGMLVWPRRADKKEWEPFVWGLMGALLTCALHDFAVRRYLMILPFIQMIAWRATRCHGVGADPCVGPVNAYSRMTQTLALFLAFSGIPLILGHFCWVPTKYVVGCGALLAGWALLNISRLENFAVRALPKVGGGLLALSLMLLVLQQGVWRLAVTHHTHDLIRDCADRFNRPGPPVYGVVAPLFTLESARQAVFIDQRMGDPLRGRPVPPLLDLITYTQPRFGYENRVVEALASRYSQHDLILDGPMFSEADTERMIGVFRLCRPKQDGFPPLRE